MKQLLLPAEALTEIQPKPHWAESAACLYLLLPVFLFFAWFVTAPIAALACFLIGRAAWRLARADWRPALTPANLGLIALALVWTFAAGDFGVISQGGDWVKHYAVANYVASSPTLHDASGDALRYALGWYMVPALVLKVVPSLYEVMGLWTALGVFLLFRLLVGLAGGGRRALWVPVIFAMFSGLDVVGTWLTGYQHGPALHLEWWAGWIEYPSAMTSLAWTPQHALPGWLLVALVMGQLQRPSLAPHLGLLLAGALLWSPFAVMGVLPFAVYLLAKQPAIMLERGNWLALAVAAPLLIYLTAGAAKLPAMAAWNQPCGPTVPCFGAWPWLRFVLLEFGLPVALLLAWKPGRTGVLLVAAGSLLLIPLLRLGEFNDFGMRASIPALAVVAILAARMMVTAPARYVVPLVAIFSMGAVTAVLETVSKTRSPIWVIERNVSFSRILPEAPYLQPQYFARVPGWLVR